jgi:membrane protease YdiL (CAAX protease family)
LFALNSVLRNSRIAMFFLIAYAISWTAWFTLFVQRFSPFAGRGRCLYVAAVIAPHVAALVITAVEGGLAGLRAFYRRVLRKVPLGWAIVAICVSPIIYLIRDVIYVGLSLAHGAFFRHPPRTVSMLIIGQLVVVLGEEPGWRGFALPRLIARFGPIGGTLLLGIAWAVWHLPLFMIAGTSQYRTGFLPFALMLLAWSMVITLLVLRAQGSVIPAMLFHASVNICAFVMWEPDAQLLALGPWIVAAVIAGWRLWMQAES